MRFSISSLAHVATGQPRVAVTSDGTLGVIQDRTRTVMVELPGGAQVAHLEVDAAAETSEVAWVGTPPRLLVLARHATHTRIQLIDPQAPHEALASVELEGALRLAAVVGPHALVIGGGAFVLSAADASFTPYPFRARTLPTVAGATATQFLVALPAAIEEWDPQSRMAKRRFRLPRPAVITALGGSDRTMWMTTEEAPARLDVVVLVNRGQPRAHELPEPIAAVSGHPRNDLVVCVGAVTGHLYLVDLDGRAPIHTIAEGELEQVEQVALVVGRGLGVLAACRGRPSVVITLEPPRSLALGLGASGAALEPEAAPDEPARRSTLYDDPEVPSVAQLVEHVESVPTVGAGPWPPAPAPVTASGLPRESRSLAARFATRRDGLAHPRSQPESEPPRATPAVTPSRWRAAIAAWTRAIVAGEVGGLSPPPVATIDVLAARFELAAPLVPALILLYGARLAGDDGAAPVDVARVLRCWDEALGRGALAASGIAVFARSRVALAAAALRVLDEVPPTTGTLVGEPGTIALLGPCFVVAGGDRLEAIAARCIPRVGSAILAGHRGAALDELVLEARARGAVALVRASPDLAQVGIAPTVFVVEDPAHGARLGIPALT